MELQSLRERYLSKSSSLPQNELKKWIHHFQTFFSDIQMHQYTKTGFSVIVSLTTLIEYFGEEFLTVLYQDPSAVISCLSYAAHCTLWGTLLRHGSLIIVRLININQMVSIPSLNPTHINTLISLIGIVSCIYPIKTSIKGSSICSTCGLEYNYNDEEKSHCPQCRSNFPHIIDRNPIITETQCIEISTIE